MGKADLGYTTINFFSAHLLNYRKIFAGKSQRNTLSLSKCNFQTPNKLMVRIPLLHFTALKDSYGKTTLQIKISLKRSIRKRYMCLSGVRMYNSMV